MSTPSSHTTAPTSFKDHTSITHSTTSCTHTTTPSSHRQYLTTEIKENAHLGIMILRSRVSALADPAAAWLTLAVLIVVGGV